MPDADSPPRRLQAAVAGKPRLERLGRRPERPVAALSSREKRATILHRALELGLEPALSRHGIRTRRFSFHPRHGRLIHEEPAGLGAGYRGTAAFDIAAVNGGQSPMACVVGRR